jgi:hypothetical protein
VNIFEAREPVILERDGVRFGFLQRTSVYWSHGHEATANYPGVATIKAHTAYRPQIEQLRTLTRPGVPPEIVTWADPPALAQFREDLVALRRRADVVIASHHWGLDHEVLAYQVEIAHTAIDAGAGLVMSHGPHLPLGIEIYKDKPIFYGVESFSFETGHRGRTHPDWIGLMLHVAVEDVVLVRAAFSFVRHNAQNETVSWTAHCPRGKTGWSHVPGLPGQGHVYQRRFALLHSFDPSLDSGNDLCRVVHCLPPSTKCFYRLGRGRPRRDRGGQLAATSSGAIPIGIVMLQASLLGGVAVVIEYHGENGHVALLAQTEAGDHGVVVKASIPYRGHDQPAGHSQLHPQGVGQPLAQATKAPHVAPCPRTLQVSVQHVSVDNELVDDYCIMRDSLVEGMAQPSGVNGACVLGGQRLLSCCFPQTLVIFV